MDRSEVTRQYKETPPDAGVYVIRNGRNGKAFVGRSVNVEGILNRHRFDLRIRSHRNRALQADWLEAGEDAFAFEVLERIDLKKEKVTDLNGELKILEALWLEKLRPWGDRGYNPPPKAD